MGSVGVLLTLCLAACLPCRGLLGDLLCPPPASPNVTEYVCSSPSLVDFPSGFPKETRSISVEFTNVSIIGLDAFRALPQLRELHLSNNQLKTLPNSLLRGHGGLSALDLTNNLLRDLPLGIFSSLAGLKQLSLKGNRLALLRPSWFRALRQLRILDLSDNRFRAVPDACFAHLEQLTDLDLSHNALRVLSAPALEGLLRLQGLNLEANRLQSVAGDAFRGVPELRFLFLQNNSLEQLPGAAFAAAKSLELLDLSRNRLSALEPPFSARVAEAGLDLSGNPWACDCRMSALVEWARNHSVSLYSEKDVTCFSPAGLRGRAVTSLGGSKFGSC